MRALAGFRDAKGWIGPSIVLATLGLSAPAIASEKFWHPHIELEAKPGDDRNVFKADFFLPIWQNENSLLYSLSRGVFTDDPSEEGNFGVGFRRLVDGDMFDAIFGAYAFFDARNSPNDNFFRQATIGAEVLTEHFELRGNVYLADDQSYLLSPTVGTSTVLSVSGSSVIETATTTGTYEISLPGFDVEAGLRADIANAVNVGLYGGYFDFERDGIEVNGPRGRLELQVDDPLGWQGASVTVGGEVRDDDIRGTDGFGFARLRLPLDSYRSMDDGYGLTTMQQRMTRRVVRDTDVVTVDNGGQVLEQTQQAATDVSSGQTIEALFVSQDGAGTECSQANPCTLTQAMSVDGRGDVFVLLQNGSGDILNPTGLNLLESQQVVGGGDDGMVSSTLSNANGGTLELTGLGINPVLDAGSNVTPGITLADENSIRGIEINGGSSGIFGTGFKNALIDDVEISEIQESNGSGAFGIDVDNGSNLTISNTTITSIAPTTDMSVSGIDSFNTDGLTLTNVNVTDLNAQGDSSGLVGLSSALDQDVMLTNVNFQRLSSDSAVTGLYVSSVGGTSGFSFDGGTISDLTGDADNDQAGTGTAVGAWFGSSATSRMLNNVSFSNITSNDQTTTNGFAFDGIGVYLESATGATTLSGVTMNNINSHGIGAYMNAGDLTINNNSSFSGIAKDDPGSFPAIWIRDSGSSTFTFQDSSLDDTGYIGIYAINAGNPTADVVIDIINSVFTNIPSAAVYLDPGNASNGGAPEYVATVMDNIFGTTGNEVNQAMFGYARNNAEFTIDYQDNTIHADTAIDQFRADTSGCLLADISGNTYTGSVPGIHLNENGGFLIVEQASSAAVGAANGGVAITETGTPFYGGTSCP